MTDKQIIIDGIDVSGCSFFDIHYSEDEDVEIKNFCRIVHYNCDSYPNCYYKQLKAKEQECEELAYENYELNELFDRLKAENEELKETFDGLFKVQYQLADNNKKLRQCLTEIKEIAITGLEGFCPKCSRKECEDNNCIETAIRDILQKISECEGNDEKV